MNASVRIGLAISGGGFRAMAFGIGALRALEDADLLDCVRVVSGISGGSILAAYWAYGPPDFDAFDLSVRQLLRQGLQLELARRAFTPQAMARSVGASITSIASGRPRAFSRTEALVAALKHRGLDVSTTAVNRPDLNVILTSTDLASGSAVRFGSAISSNWMLGRIVDDVRVADAVAASAAFPLLLPPLVRQYEFEKRGGTRHTRTLVMTDGGVYDNLGATPLLPGRSRDYTDHVYDIDLLIVVDSGRGRFDRRPAGNWINRTAQTFSISHGRVQDGTRAQIHDQASRLGSLVHVYLGTRDDKLPPIGDLVPRDSIADYPTNFAPMAAEKLEALSVRAEQITRALLAEYVSGNR